MVKNTYKTHPNHTLMLRIFTLLLAGLSSQVYCHGIHSSARTEGHHENQKPSIETAYQIWLAEIAELCSENLEAPYDIRFEKLTNSYRNCDGDEKLIDLVSPNELTCMQMESSEMSFMHKAVVYMTKKTQWALGDMGDDLAFIGMEKTDLDRGFIDNGDADWQSLTLSECADFEYVSLRLSYTVDGEEFSGVATFLFSNGKLFCLSQPWR